MKEWRKGRDGWMKERDGRDRRREGLVQQALYYDNGLEVHPSRHAAAAAAAAPHQYLSPHPSTPILLTPPRQTHYTNTHTHIHKYTEQPARGSITKKHQRRLVLHFSFVFVCVFIFL